MMQNSSGESNSVVILFGGTSDERRVSVASAQNIASELVDAELWFMDLLGSVHGCDRAATLAFERPFERDFEPRSTQIFKNLEQALTGARDKTFVLALHGGDGEDGTVQKVFERIGVAFTGSGSLASHKAFDKRIAKRIAKEMGVTVAQEAEILPHRAEESRQILAGQLAEFGELILKPVASGSSIGLFRIHREADIAPVEKEISKLNLPYLCEPFIRGVEITVGIYDDGSHIRALPPSEVRLEANRNFDYEGKYLGKGTIEITPAEVSDATSLACQKVSLAMHKALGCEGYSRADFIVHETRGPVFLETNTLPGLTRASFIPQQLAAAKIPFRDFLHAQIHIARRRVRPAKQ